MSEKNFHESVWVNDAPGQAASWWKYLAAAVTALFVTWLVLTVMLAFTFITGILSSEGLSSEQFYDRNELWVIAIVAPLAALAYLLTLHGACTWFADKIYWWEALVATVITILAFVLLRETGLGLGLGTVAISAVAVALFLRWRQQERIIHHRADRQLSK